MDLNNMEAVGENAVVVARAVGGISLNGREFLLNEDNELMVFEDEDLARVFLAEHGFTEEALDELDYILYKELNQDEYYETRPH